MTPPEQGRAVGTERSGPSSDRWPVPHGKWVIFPLESQCFSHTRVHILVRCRSCCGGQARESAIYRLPGKADAARLRTHLHNSPGRAPSPGGGLGPPGPLSELGTPASVSGTASWQVHLAKLAVTSHPCLPGLSVPVGTAGSQGVRIPLFPLTVPSPFSFLDTFQRYKSETQASTPGAGPPP